MLLALCAGSALCDPSRIVLMTFNVENLFDTVDDPHKLDDTFLPIELKASAGHRARCAALRSAREREECLAWDWSDAVLARKLERLAAVILQVNGGRGPDILALQEVENRGVLERLRSEHLATAGFRESILIEGDDPRGIDVAFLSRFPLHGEARLHRRTHAPGESGDVRGILEATFELGDGTLITGYCVHLPAPMHPAAARFDALERLDTLAAALPPGRMRFAAGDFNINSAEERRYDVIRGRLATHWIAAHAQGCSECSGTYYYARDHAWSFLDMILVGRELDAREPRLAWRLAPESVDVAHAVAAQSTSAGYPARFDPREGSGVSDHWPLVATLVASSAAP
jgi:endonuclease/exonuclease/phosphatase family metal-dependent hydrolase